MIIDEARDKIKNKQLTPSQILASFNMIGSAYLKGEGGYYNTDRGLTLLTYDYNIGKDELLKYLRISYYDGDYHPNDRYVSFDGHSIVSFNTLDYFTSLLMQKMNNECAEYILSLE